MVPLVRRVSEPALPYGALKPAVSLMAACAVLTVGFLVRVPNPAEAPQVRADKVDIEQ